MRKKLLARQLQEVEGFEEAHKAIFNGRLLYSAVFTASAIIAGFNYGKMAFEPPFHKVILYDSLIIAMLDFANTCSTSFTPYFEQLRDPAAVIAGCRSLLPLSCKNFWGSLWMVLKLSLCSIASLATLANSLAAGTSMPLALLMSAVDLFASYLALSSFINNLSIQWSTYKWLLTRYNLTPPFCRNDKKDWIARRNMQMTNIERAILAASLYKSDDRRFVQHIIQADPSIHYAQDWQSVLRAFANLGQNTLTSTHRQAYRSAIAVKLLLFMPLCFITFSIAASQMGSIQQAFKEFLPDAGFTALKKLSAANSERVQAIGILPLWAIDLDQALQGFSTWIDVILAKGLYVYEQQIPWWRKIKSVFGLPLIIGVSMGALSYSLSYYIARNGLSDTDNTCDSYIGCPATWVTANLGSAIPTVSAVFTVIQNSAFVMTWLKSQYWYLSMGGRMCPRRGDYSPRNLIGGHSPQAFRLSMLMMADNTKSEYDNLDLSQTKGTEPLPESMVQAQALMRGYEPTEVYYGTI